METKINKLMVPPYYWVVCKNTLSYLKMRTHTKEGWVRYWASLNEPQNKKILKEVFSNKRIIDFSLKENPKEFKILQSEVFK